MAKIQLRFIDGPHVDATYSFDGPSISLGRVEANDVCMEGDMGVSSDHARIVYEDGNWFLEDRGSTNGTFVKKGHAFARIREKTPLVSGQCIKLGRSQIVVTTDAAEQDTLIVTPAGQTIAEVDELDESIAAQPGHLSRQFVRVEAGDGVLRYEFASHGAIGARSTIPYDPSDVEQLRAKLFDLAYRTRQRTGSGNSKLVEAFMETGKMLAHQIFPKRIYNALENTGLQPLIFVHTTPLVGVPWELAVVGHEMIGPQFCFGRQVMLDQHSSIMDVARASTSAIQRPRLLIVCNPTGDLEELEASTESLLVQFQTAGLDWPIEFVARERVERLDVLSRLARADFVYYVGHAEYDAESPENSGWLLQDGRLTCQDIRKLPKAPAAVFANGCETGREGDWDESGSLANHAFGLASAFLLSGASCYVGSAWPIAPDSAAVFARAFFEQLAAGVHAGECVRAARVETRGASEDGDLTWASYVMYGDPAAQLFNPAKKSL